MPRVRPLLRAFTFTALPLLALSVSREAAAFERQWHVGADAGYAALIQPTGATQHGFGGGLHLTYGLSDTVNLLALVDVTKHFSTTHEGQPVPEVLLGGGSLGFGYVFDILSWVPYVGATAGAYYLDSPAGGGGRLALQIPFGLDYQISRSFAVGASGEYKLLFLDAAGISQRFVAYVRAEYIWGF